MNQHQEIKPKEGNGKIDWTSMSSIFKWTVKNIGIPGTIVLVIVLAPYVKEYMRPAGSEVGMSNTENVFDPLSRIESKLEAHANDSFTRDTVMVTRLNTEVEILKAILEVAKDRNEYARSQTTLLRLLCRDQVAKDLKSQCEK